MKLSKRLIAILDRCNQMTPRITCSRFFASYLEEDAIVHNEVKHHLQQTNDKSKIFDSLRMIDEESTFSLYNSYLISDGLLEAFKYGAARAEKFNQVILTEAHIVEGIISSLPHANDWQNLLQLACAAQDLHMTFPLPSIQMTHAADITIADITEMEEVLLFVEEHFGLRWTSQVTDSLLKKENGAFIIREEGILRGFACYQKQNDSLAVFGPMGINKKCRGAGYGRSLVLTVFHHLEQLSFKEVIISQAGPIEFYERILPVTLSTKEKG